MPSSTDRLRSALPDTNRAVSPVIAVILLVAITVALAGAVTILSGSFGDKLDDSPTNVDNAISIDETGAGSVASAEYVSSNVTVELNGQPMANFTSADAGEERFLPTAPGDKVQVISHGEGSSIILNERVDKFSAGDFIAYYTFEEQSGDTFVDQSGIDNDGTLYGSQWSWVEDSEGTAVEFTGDGGNYGKVAQLNAKKVEDVKEFTVVTKYRVDQSTGDVQQIVEHRNDSTNFEWFLETDNFDGSAYDMRYNVRGDGAGEPDGTLRQTNLNTGDVHVLVATYDGDQMRYYVDGSLVATSDEPDRTVEMGTLIVGADAIHASSQHLDGRIYELRLYYTSVDDGEAEMLTKAVEQSGR